jgi:uncharacterized protein (TIGR04255 family)
MAEQRHLNNAPITEAIIDFRAKSANEFKVDQFESIKSELEKNYPIMEKQQASEVRLEFKEGKPKHFPVEDLGTQGYLFKTNDKIQIAQYRLNGFTFNRLKPYTRWDDVFEEAKRLWGLYREVARPEIITRLAVRYINHLKLPLPVDNFGDYLVAPPVVPDSLPQQLLRFLNKLVIIDDKNKIIANIIQASDEKGSDNKHLNIILDIDAYKIVDYNCETDEMWDIFKKLRQMKNEIFFKSLTEKTVGLFE